VADGFVRHPQQHFSCILVVASRGQPEIDFVPHKPKSLRIIEYQSLKHRAVWNSSNPPIVKVATHPVAGFHDGRSHDGDLNHISLGVIHLDSIADSVQIGELDCNETAKACDHVLQSNNDSRSK